MSVCAPCSLPTWQVYILKRGGRWGLRRWSELKTKVMPHIVVCGNVIMNSCFTLEFSPPDLAPVAPASRSKVKVKVDESMTERIELPEIEFVGIIVRRLVRGMPMPVRALTRDCAPLSSKRSSALQLHACIHWNGLRRACPHPCMQLYTPQACYSSPISRWRSSERIVNGVLSGRCVDRKKVV